MKKFFLTLMCTVMLTACGSSIDKLESFVEDTEKECAEFSAEEWEDNDKEFQELMEDLQADKDELTTEELEKTGKLTARYMKLKMKQGMKSMEKVGSFMKGMMSNDEE